MITHLKDIRYDYDDKIRKLHLEKKVRYFLMEYDEGRISTADEKVETVVWIDIDEAIKRVTFESERQTLKQAKEYLKNKDFQSK